MPLNIPDNLPAGDILAKEDIFLMPKSEAKHQDIRALHILMLNLMPKKIETETHFLRLLSNSAVQIELDLLHIQEHESRNTPREHIESFYRSFDEVKDQKYDGLIITGAPLGLIDFEDVSYWPHLKEIMDWSQTHVTSTMFICWAALAAVWHFYDIPKHTLSEKLFGVYPHNILKPHHPILRGGDDVFWAPHSRNGAVHQHYIVDHEDLELIADSEIAGPYLFTSKDQRQLFVLGHAEYDPLCLKGEFERDQLAGLNPNLPENYFPEDDPTHDPVVRWRSHGNLIFSNWLNYFVYQKTPFNRDHIGLQIKESL